MEVDGGRVVEVSTGDLSVPRHTRKHKAFYQFTQQNLPACKPVLTPAWVITTFLLMGVIFIPLGLITLHASDNVVEIVDRYDSECVPEAFRSNKVAYIKDDSIPKNCSRCLIFL
ncbi:putative ALA-interacting subunit 2 [Argentina anserina]|uniref:putative ALA-interacting subunit 2 n=1 Tax=Argentina anserina TaxID=57926 RepID=UPI00217625F7|nr:putative ALA-interacting subunit 2 [Potentilla anserina]XP_050374638.1 putative ALA-interacting subunit 2 [Potentilla anserina]XP_050374643.1 putative ALA-interacting subunit 2 [Potentilla anserina]XP_050374649.1 putative ALA-interacting subunit 2 [Potentilla anserina]XP_050374654.1 putative ALA-interacting subunit 2 [Potentilla anserina]XP_050374658.1 putative ALA-interacting subunit 2 [Potentilla anserina]XP_050374663.1 putative ALA-interacting subunit 2 [Potentilla anserina]XP_05037466